jgi:tetratricopeptide (TPR) repeat protein
VNPGAYQLYLRGRYEWNKRTPQSIEKSIHNFQQAINKDPRYAAAYAGLANAYNLLSEYEIASPWESFPKAEQAALKALKFDNTLPTAHVALARFKGDYERDWSGAEREFNLALMLNPSDATAHQWYATHLMRMGRIEFGLSEIRRAQELDPLSLMVRTGVGMGLYRARQYDNSIDQVRKVIQADPSFPVAHFQLGLSYAKKGMLPDSIAEFQTALELSPSASDYLAGLGNAYGLAGRRHEALEIVARLKAARKQRYVKASSLGLVYAGLGDNDHAFEWLEKAYQEHDNKLLFLAVEPALDNLRPNRRYRILLERLGLRNYAPRTESPLP